MARPTESEIQLDKVILLFLFALFLLLSPLINWWAADDSPWYSPYLIWLTIIILAFILQRRARRNAV